MITIEHRWVDVEPARVGATTCTNCEAVCDVSAVDRGGPFFAANGKPLGREPPPCALVPRSDHTYGPWQTDGSHVYGPDPNRELIAHIVGYASGSIVHNRNLIARAPAMWDALEATLLFHAVSIWDDVARVRWRELTRSDEATTRTLCDAIRRALRYPTLEG